jgi:short-subunit dehydrogenase involved in D-alanine esterification of teichoic acids
MRPKIIVPTYAEFVEMDTTELIAFRVELVDAAQSIQTQLQEAANEGHPDPIWTARSQTALSHMRRGLATIKAELAKRNGSNSPAALTDHIQEAFGALDILRNTLKQANVLFAAVEALLDDDNDNNWARLEDLVQYAEPMD